MLDDTDRRILRLLQAEPMRGVPELAEAIGATPARLTRRLERLRSDGVLRGSHIVIDWKALGYTVSVSLRITLDKTVSRTFDDFIAAARAVPEVIEIQTFLGRVDVRLSLIARDLPDYQRIYREQVLTLPHIADIEALMTVASVKSDESLPL
ncbi:MAG: Lrp/AsnC family transcriptional regulator [Yoonia sp.]|jgi:Lrp/AsnC family transcriptional regulator